VSLTRRYFADPIHRLRAEGDVRRALLTFEDAQRWVFYTSRALEYKWNVEFRQSEPDMLWTVDSVFGLRNADELDLMYQAMADFNEDRIFTFFQPQLDVISIREDVLGYVDDVDEFGDPLLYPDPDPDSDALLTAMEAFRSFLQQLPRDPFGDPIVTFSSARQFPFSGLFLPSTTLDKIDKMVIALPGDHNMNTTQGTLKYSGTSLIRTVNRPDPPPPDDRADRQPDEFVGFSTRSWRSDLQTGKLVSDEGLTVPTQLLLNLEPPTGCTSIFDWIIGFKERSVATSVWELTFPSFLIDRIDDIEFHICHRWALRGS
jgi:hypothetical protein